MIREISSARSCIGYLVGPLLAARKTLSTTRSAREFFFQLGQLVLDTAVEHLVSDSSHDATDDRWIDAGGEHDLLARDLLERALQTAEVLGGQLGRGHDFGAHASGALLGLVFEGLDDLGQVLEATASVRDEDQRVEHQLVHAALGCNVLQDGAASLEA